MTYQQNALTQAAAGLSGRTRAATALGFSYYRGFSGFGDVPQGAVPVAQLMRYNSTYVIDEPGFEPPQGASHFLPTVETDALVARFYNDGGQDIGIVAYPARASLSPTTPSPTPTGPTTPTSKLPGQSPIQKAASTVTSWFQPKTPSGPTSAPSSGPIPPAFPTSTTSSGVPDWVMPVAIIGAVLLVSGGLYYAMRGRRRSPALAANPRRRRRSRRSARLRARGIGPSATGRGGVRIKDADYYRYR